MAVLARIALAAPAAADRCPLLLRQLGPRVAYEVNVKARASAASDAAPVADSGAGWMSTAEAAGELGITADGVRWLLRKGQLGGHRTERGWQVDVTSVMRRRDGRQTAA